ncbi:hypothetical protein P7C71_g6579, partial [Lecanoromycetidae sp. Uapishka_2]
MLSQKLLSLALLLPFSKAAETILGVYIFSRHGDRTSKATPPTVLTDLGYSEVFASGTWFRNQYIANGSTSQIYNIESDIVKQSQIVASAPLDDVLMPSCLGFLQGLYPPVGPTLGSQKLRNGTVVEVPLSGYQIIPVATVTSGTGSEDAAWLQGSGNCAKAIISSNNYFSSPEYTALLNSTMGFYSNLNPVVNSTFTATQNSFLNAYSMFDYLNVAEIHNTTIPYSDLVTNDTLFQLRTLADTHEYNLAYNASDPIRAITGATIAAEVVQALNATVTGAGKTPINIQFGAYGGFQSFFGLANLTSANPDFYGIPDYASTMTFELFTNAPPSPFPSPDQLGVRFLFHNGTTGNNSVPVPYPLFGSSNTTMAWNDFVAGMGKFSIGSQEAWCQACGNSTGVCASATASTSPSSGGAAKGTGSGSGSGGISKAVAGVIGAFVTLAVILGIEGLVMLVAGLRLVKKNRLSAGAREGAVAPKA